MTVCVTGIRSVAVDVCGLNEAAGFYSDVWRLDPAGTDGEARYFRGTVRLSPYPKPASCRQAGNPASRVCGGGSRRRRGASCQGKDERRRDRGAARLGRARRRLRLRLQGPGGTQSRGRVRRRGAGGGAGRGPAAQDHACQSQCRGLRRDHALHDRDAWVPPDRRDRARALPACRMPGSFLARAGEAQQCDAQPHRVRHDRSRLW